MKLQYQLNHGPDGWQTQNNLTQESAERLRAHMLDRGRIEGGKWRVFDPAAQPAAETTQPAAQPAKRTRAPRKPQPAAEGTTAGRKAPSRKATQPAAAKRPTRARKSTQPAAQPAAEGK